MQIIRANYMGMCFGVKNALKKVGETDDLLNLTIYGDLVHNEKIIQNLSGMGVKMISESERPLVPRTTKVLISAHGISDSESNWLRSNAKTLIDTTCPHVKQIHEHAKNFNKMGFTVVVIGKKDHVEVKGLVGDLNSYYIIEKPDEVKRFKEKYLGVICQSTISPDFANTILLKIKSLNHDREIKYINTICKPTIDRQLAVKNLLSKVDAVVVVGGSNSNNTKKLLETANSKNIPAIHIQSANDLCPTWFKDFKRVGLTAGASTLDITIEEVYQKLLSINRFNNIKKKLINAAL
ncbi:MAG: 4-hydroxy-3-methylbut-2-enyl diphosphate reductase [Spirochaetota bacterium]|nr:4-hydroxy-3-methylbut-2-enyl diphosphate reductase [Spirochaetota bacterium]